jgi:hypothetical protein
MKAAKLCSANQEWRKNELLGMCQQSIAVLHGVFAREKGIDPIELEAETREHDDPSDTFGNALARIEARQRRVSKPSGKSSGRSSVVCYYCKKPGHTAHRCFKRKEDGAPVPARPVSDAASLNGERGVPRRK